MEQDLMGANDLQNGEETVQNFTKGTSQRPEKSWDHSNSPCSAPKVHAYASLKFFRDHLDDLEEDWKKGHVVRWDHFSQKGDD